MKHLKKLTALFLAAALALSMAACGGASSAPASGPVSGSASAGDGAQRLTMLVPNNTNQYIKFDEREDYPVWQELKALFAQKGLELEFEVVPADQYPTTLQTRIASGTDLPDIVYEAGPENQSFYL